MTQRVASEVLKKRSPIMWIFFFFGAIVLSLLVWSAIRMLRDAPNLQATVGLPGSGWVTVQVITSPNPPLTTGTVTLNFMPLDNARQMVDLGRPIPFSYGMRGSDQPVGSGQAVLDAMGMSYQAGVQFLVVGDYWLVLDLAPGKQVRYQFSVRPVQ